MKKQKSKRKKTGGKKGKEKTPRLTPALHPSPISLCMIVKNEERFLPGCLQSVTGLVGEIVVVDTGSTDQTVEIARSFGAKVYNFKWNNDFAAARNFALRHCTLPWILYLDADERLHPEYHSEIRKAIEANQADAFYLKVYSNVSGILGNVPHIQAYPRLFKKLPGARFEGKIHEQITPSLKRLKARFKYLDVTIEHLGYEQDDEVLREKIQRNLQYLKNQVKKEPNNAYALFQLGQTYLLDGQVEEGKVYLKQALNLNILPNNLTATILLMLANEHFKLDEIEAAHKYLQEALQLAPRQRLGYFLQSECFAREHKWEEAVVALHHLQENSKKPFSDLSIEKNFEEYLINQRLALYSFYLKKYGDATLYFERYFREAPNYRSSLLAKWAFSWQAVGALVDSAEEMLRFFREKMACFDDPGEAAKTLAGVAEKIDNNLMMEHYLNICTEYNPGDQVALYYLGNLYMKKGELSQAELYYEQSLKVNPGVWEVYYNLAVCKIKSLHFADAIRILESALEIFPEKKANVQRLLAGLYAKIGDYQKVMEFVEVPEVHQT